MTLLRSSRLRRLLAGVGIASLLLPAAGCMGPFAATRRLWHWNRHLEGEWAREAVFVGTGVLTPVYLGCAIGDALFFNTVRFWSGESLIDLPGGDHRLQAAAPWESDPALDGLVATGDVGAR
jgi:hypothetical protein